MGKRWKKYTCLCSEATNKFATIDEISCNKAISIFRILLIQFQSNVGDLVMSMESFSSVDA